MASARVSNQRYDENVAKNGSKLLQNSSSVNCALRAKAIVDGLGKNYANLQAVAKICQFFISELSTVINSTNQILIPGAGIMERRHQWNVYRLPCALLLTRPLSARPARPRLHSAISPKTQATGRIKNHPNLKSKYI